MMEHGKQRVQALHEAKSTLQSTLGEQEAALGEDKQRLLEVGR